jgi:uncharacterized iron-regulated protein
MIMRISFSIRKYHSNVSRLKRLLFIYGAFITCFFSNFPLHAEDDITTLHANPDQESNITIKPVDNTAAIRLGNSVTIKDLIPELADKRVIYVGETHTRYDHHLLQLEIIKLIHALHPDLAIGMEYFQQPYQQYLDGYINGEIDEREMLRLTEYYERWRYDYRLYAPILRYAQEHGIPLVALNLPAEITRKVSRDGLDSLSDTQREQVPADIDRSDEAYTKRLKKIFKEHPSGQTPDFEHFLTAQLLWDEGMAQQVADYLSSNPSRRMIVLAGSGHLAYGSGIPNRVARRIPVASSLIINSWEGELDPTVADFLLLPQEQELPKAGKLGAMLDEDKANQTVKLDVCLPDSPCAKTGLKKGDQILSIDDEIIANMADLRVMMWDKRPGDEISLTIRREHWFSSEEDMTYKVTLE